MAERGGQPGNQNARNAKRFLQALHRALARECGTVDEGLEKVAGHLARAGLVGEQWAVKEIADREDGKAAIAIGGDPDAPPIKTVQRIELVDLSSDRPSSEA